eukprot:5917332-Ditylum_brightwellii.AAC.1
MLVGNQETNCVVFCQNVAPDLGRCLHPDIHNMLAFAVPQSWQACADVSCCVVLCHPVAQNMRNNVC